MKFREYPKVQRLDKEECDGLLDNLVTVQEKVDGANVSLWLEDGEVQGGSRHRKLRDESFNGFVDYIKKKPAIKKWLKANPNKRLYGEWLVRHTVNYSELAWRKMYLYDVYDHETEQWWEQDSVEGLAKILGLEYPTVFARDIKVEGEEGLTLLRSFVGKSTLGDVGEGIVIKNALWRNQFGDHVYAKMVHPSFKESNSILFNSTDKSSPAFSELTVIKKYATLARLEKVMHKLQPEIDHKLSIEDTARVINTAYHDMLTEEIWDMTKHVVSLNFKTLQRLATKKFAQTYHDILSNRLSVAYKRELDAS